MFKKRKRIQVPEHVFIPKKARLLSILQLCIAFTLFIWYCTLPFMGELFAIKSQVTLYHYVMGIAPVKAKPTLLETFQRNRERFAKLSQKEQDHLWNNYKIIHNAANASFFSKLMRSLKIILFQIPPFILAWILLSVILSIMVLKRVDGASGGLWLLPIVCLGYLFSQWTHPIQLSQEEMLFPSEKTIIENYLGEPLSQNTLEQKEQLEQGWNLYLIKEWAKEAPSDQSLERLLQIEKGHYAFTLSRILHSNPFAIHEISFKKEPLFILLLYFFWNFYIALTVNLELWKERKTLTAARQFT